MSIKIQAFERTDLRKAYTKQLRKNGHVPAVIYGRTGSHIIYVNESEFNHAMPHFSGSIVIEVEFNGKIIPTLLKQYEYDHVKDSIRHLDFYQLDDAYKIKVFVPFQLEGIPEGVRIGGVLSTPIRGILLETLPKHLPETIVIDINKLAVGQSVLVQDLELDDTIRILSAKRQTIVAVAAGRLMRSS